MVREIEIIAEWPLLSAQILLTTPEEPVQKKRRADNSISFDNFDLEGILSPHMDPLVINARLGDLCYNMKKILVDNESSVDVLFYSTFLNLGLKREKL